LFFAFRISGPPTLVRPQHQTFDRFDLSFRLAFFRAVDSSRRVEIFDPSIVFVEQIAVDTMAFWTGKFLPRQVVASVGNACSVGAGSRVHSRTGGIPIEDVGEDFDDIIEADVPDDMSEIGADEACERLESFAALLEAWDSESGSESDVPCDDASLHFFDEIVPLDSRPDSSVRQQQQQVPPVADTGSGGAASSSAGPVHAVVAAEAAAAPTRDGGDEARARQKHGTFSYGCGHITLRSVTAISLDVHCHTCKAKFDRKRERFPNATTPGSYKRAQGRRLGLMFLFLSVKCPGPGKQQEHKALLKQWAVAPGMLFERRCELRQAALQDPYFGPLFDAEADPWPEETRGEPFELP
jgi:hypothetical protein